MGGQWLGSEEEIRCCPELYGGDSQRWRSCRKLGFLGRWMETRVSRGLLLVSLGHGPQSLLIMVCLLSLVSGSLWWEGKEKGLGVLKGARGGSPVTLEVGVVKVIFSTLLLNFWITPGVMPYQICPIIFIPKSGCELKKWHLREFFQKFEIYLALENMLCST